MLNKKNSGMTIVEIIISLAIISLVLILLFALLMHVRDEDLDNSVQSNFVINQSSFIKTIEEDIINYGIKGISHCSLGDANLLSSVAKGFENEYMCVKFDYAADYTTDKTGYLVVYNYYTKYEKINGVYVGTESEWVLQYVRGHYLTCESPINPVVTSWRNRTSLLRIIPSKIDFTKRPYLVYTANASKSNAASLVVPIVTPEGVHYDINLSFVFKGNNNFICNNSNDDKLKCLCQSTEALCNNTYNYTNYCG